MDSFSTQTLFAALAVLLLTSAFFSASETAMMAINRYRLRHAAESGVRGPLSGLRVLEGAIFGAGPMCGMVRCGRGAESIRWLAGPGSPGWACWDTPCCGSCPGIRSTPSSMAVRGRCI